MRNLINIVEAPLGDIHRPEFATGDESSFRPSDQKIIQAPKAEAKWRRTFQRCPYEVDLAFVETRLRDIFADGLYDYQTIKERLPELPEARPEAVMLAMTNNEGANRVPLSGWIIAHRLGHALVMTGGGEVEAVFENTYHTLNDIVGSLYDGWEIPRISAAYALGKMRSCREHQLNSYLELIFELFAQFMITGKASMNRLSKDTKFYKTGGEELKVMHEFRDDDLKMLNDTIESVEYSLQRAFERSMGMVIGKCVVL